MLLNRPNLIYGESLSSYIYRIAKENLYGSPFVIVKEVKLQKHVLDSNIFRNETIREIQKLSGKAFDQLYSSTSNGLKSRLTPTLFNFFLLKTRTKFCPECLKNAPHHKSIWSINLITICTEHFNLLIDYCPECNNKIDVSCLLQDCCKNCKFQLSRAKTSLIKNVLELIGQREILKEIQNEKTTGILSGLTFNEYLFLIQKSFYLLEGNKSFIQPYSEPIESFIFRKYGSFSNEKLLIALTNFNWMFREFPDNFYKVLDGFFSLNYQKRRRRKKEFYQLFCNPKFNFIKEAIVEYENKQIQNRNVSANFLAYNPDNKVLLSSNFLNKKEIESKLQITRSQVNTLLSSDQINVEKIEKGKKVFYKIDRNSLNTIDLLNQNYQDLITRKKAAQMLGINVDRISALIKQQLLNVYTLHNKKNTFLSCSEVSDLLNSLLENCVKRKPENSISFYKLIDKYATSGLSVKRIIELLNGGKIEGYTEITEGEIKLPDLFFLEEPIRYCLKEIKKECQKYEVYSFMEVVRILKINERKLHKFIKKKLINPLEVKYKNNGMRYTFAKEEVESFQKNFINTQEASNKYKISQQLIRNWVYRGKIVNQLSGVCKSILVNVTDLEQLLSQSKLKR